jgi:hypothetical protein
VNAGPVHAYIAASNSKTAYLAELKAGQEVLVVDAEGIPRTEVIGRCKVRMLASCCCCLTADLQAVGFAMVHFTIVHCYGAFLLPLMIVSGWSEATYVSCTGR